MARHLSVTESIAVGSTDPIGIERVGLGDQRGLFQFISDQGQPFSAKVYGTSNFSFDTSVGTHWTDITSYLFTPKDFGGGSVTFNLNLFSIWQGNTLTVPESGSTAGSGNTEPVQVSEAGFYPMPNGFIPNALFVQINSVTSGDFLAVNFGF